MTANEVFRKAYISYSRLSSYDKCPRKFKLVYLDGHETPSGSPAQVGKLVHEILAHYLREKKAQGGVHQSQPGDILSRLPAVSGQLLAEKEITREITANEVEQFIRGFCALYPRIETAMIAGIEVEKNFEINGYNCKGVLDLVIQDEAGKLRIIDFKTGRPGNVEDLQLILYSMPYFDGNPDQSITASFAFLRDATVRHFEVSRSMSSNTRDIVMMKVQEIETDERFERRRGRLCDYCDVRRFCDGDLD